MKAFQDALRKGVPQLGLCVMYPASGVVERIGILLGAVFAEFGELA